MRIIHYVIFFDVFQDWNEFTERSTVSIADECTNTTREIMGYIYDKYYKKYDGECIGLYYGYIEENIMNNMEFTYDLSYDEEDNFFNNIVKISHEPIFIKYVVENEPVKNDVVYCVFDCNDYLDDSYTYVNTFTFTVGDNFNNQIKNLLENVKLLFIEKDSRNVSYLTNQNYIKCHYTIKGSNSSWKKITF